MLSTIIIEVAIHKRCHSVFLITNSKNRVLIVPPYI